MNVTNDQEIYLGLRNLIYKNVHQHLKNWGGDFDEAFSEAYIAFRESLEGYNPELSKITTWVQTCIRWHLTNNAKKRIAEPIDPSKINIPCKTNYMDTLLSEISNDAVIAVKLLIDSFEDIKKLRGKRSKEKFLANALRNMGWTRERIFQTFDEIRVSL